MYKKITCTVIICILINCVNLQKLLTQKRYEEAEQYCRNTKNSKDCYLKMADNFFNSNNYHKASKFYRKAQDKNGLIKTANIFLKLKEYNNYKSNMLFASNVILINDQFTNNHNNWPIESNTKYCISDNRLRLSNNVFNSYRYITPKNVIDFNKHKYIYIESSQRMALHDSLAAYGLIFNLLDNQNFDVFIIWTNHSYNYAQKRKGEWNTVLNGMIEQDKFHHDIFKNIAVEIIDNNIQFYINDQCVNTTVARPIGNYCGVYIDGDCSVEIDNYSILSSSTDYKLVCQSIADYAFKENDLDNAIKYYTKAKDNKKALFVIEKSISKGELALVEDSYIDASEDSIDAIINLAELCFKNDKMNDVERLCSMAGYDLNNIYNNITILNEDFSNNENVWLVKNDSTYASANIKNGKYCIEYFLENAYCVWNNDVSINTKNDYKIEAIIIKKHGLNNNSFGLTWGLKDENNRSDFGINGIGSYIYDIYNNKKYKSQIKWTYSEYINKYDNTNKIAVCKFGKELQFYINNHLVDTSKNLFHFGNIVGFNLNTKLKCCIESIVLKQFPSDRLLNLIEKYYISRNDDKNLVKIAEIYKDKYNYDKIIKYVSFLSSDPVNWNIIAEAYLIKGKIEQGKKYIKNFADYFKSESNYDLALKLYRKTNEVERIIEIADLWFNQKKYDKALSIYKEFNYKEKTKNCLNRMGNIEFDKKNDTDVLETNKNKLIKKDLSNDKKNTVKSYKINSNLQSRTINPTLLFKGQSAIIAIAYSKPNTIFALTNDGDVLKITPDGKSSTLYSGLKRCGFSNRVIASLPSGAIVVNNCVDNKDVLLKIDSNGKTKQIAKLNEILVSLSADNTGKIYLGFWITKGNISIGQYLQNAEHMYGQISELQNDSIESNLWSGGIPLSLSAMHNGKLFSCIWGKKGSFYPEPKEYSMCGPKNQFYIAVCEQSKVGFFKEDSSFNQISNKIICASYITPIKNGSVLVFGKTSQGGCAIYKLLESEDPIKVPIKPDNLIYPITDMVASEDKLYFSNSDGNIYMVPLKMIF